MKSQATTVAPEKATDELANRPVMTHLTQAEFQALERHAKRNMRSLASTIRIAVVESLRLDQ